MVVVVPQPAEAEAVKQRRLRLAPAIRGRSSTHSGSGFRAPSSVECLVYAQKWFEACGGSPQESHRSIPKLPNRSADTAQHWRSI